MGFTNLAKKLDRIIRSKKVKEAAMALVSNKKESLEFQNAYEAMVLAYKPFSSQGIHFNLLRSDSKMVFSSENTLEQIKAMTDSHGMKPEVGHAMREFTGYPFNKYEIDSKKKFRSGTKKLLKSGYGVARRYGFVSGYLENFVAKAVSGTGIQPSGYESICRVSQKVVD